MRVAALALAGLLAAHPAAGQREWSVDGTSAETGSPARLTVTCSTPMITRVSIQFPPDRDMGELHAVTDVRTIVFGREEREFAGLLAYDTSIILGSNLSGLGEAMDGGRKVRVIVGHGENAETWDWPLGESFILESKRACP